jgi:NADPH-dependent glutamate synthase beta subunit-like oxidoreductase
MSNVKLVYDDKACWGCGACEVACKQEYNPFMYHAYDPGKPAAIKYVTLKGDGPRVVDGRLSFSYRLNVCRHCDDAPCIKACPEDAISVDKETGIVVHDKEKCNGCNAVAGQSGPEKEATSPCGFNCPAGNNIQGYVSLAAKGKYREALALIKETSPFPSICGRVCHHPCESDCNRKQIDEAVSIQSVERFLADTDMASCERYVPARKERKGLKTAVVGSGPAGLTCAYYLAKEGYDVTVFEKATKPGGMLTMAIPSYRLPRDIVNAEIGLIGAMGVRLKTGVEIGKDRTFAQLREEGFKAFFVGVGTQKCLKLGIEGEDLAGIYGGLDFLKDVNLGKPVTLGKNVAVIGGGNTAIDSVRAARRIGADGAFILYRRGMEEMPARPDEVEECVDEGIPIRTLSQPVRFIGEGGRVRAVECLKVELGEPDGSGRRRPVPVKGSEFTVEVDAVINALGQEADWACLTPDCACTLTGWGTMAVDPVTFQTKDPDIFAGGDAVRGPQTVIEAIADGREAAVSIDRFLSGKDLREGRERQRKVITEPVRRDWHRARRVPTPVRDGKERVRDFGEVRLALAAEAIIEEAKRCISCGAACIQSCPYEALTFNTVTAKAQKCNLCIERVKFGLMPACADNVCLAHCVYFGDAKHIEKMIKERFWLKARLEGTLGSLVVKVGD